MIVSSPHPSFEVPATSLPDLLLKPALDPANAGRSRIPLLYPPTGATCEPKTKWDRACPLSLSEVRTRAYALAAAILDGALTKDWAKGDVVAIFSPNSHDYLVAVLGVQLAGGVPALCNPSYKPRELANQLRMTSARAIFVASSSLTSAREGVRVACSAEKADDGGVFAPLKHQVSIAAFDDVEEEGVTTLTHLLESGSNVAGAEGKIIVMTQRIKPKEDTAVLCFSSGTSGLPKAVRLSHAGLVANTIQATFLLSERFNEPLQRVPGIPANLDPSSNHHMHLDILPYFHCYGLVVLFCSLYSATPRVVLPRFNLDAFLSLITKLRVSFAFVVPPILLALASSPEVEREGVDLSSLTNVASGAAILPEELRMRVYKRLGIRSTDGYGMSEMSPIVSLQSLKNLSTEEGRRTVGFLAPNTEGRIVSPDGKELGPDEEGELQLRGPQQMLGYFQNDTATAAAFVEDPSGGQHWLRTGDMALFTPSGYLRITDRLKDVIKTKGFQVSPAEVESRLLRDERVKEVAVLGVPDPTDGNERVWAFVVHSAPQQLEGLEEQVKKQVVDRYNSDVAGYKRLQGLTWIEALPKSDAGKVLKRELRAKA